VNAMVAIVPVVGIMPVAVVIVIVPLFGPPVGVPHVRPVPLPAPTPQVAVDALPFVASAFTVRTPFVSVSGISEAVGAIELAMVPQFVHPEENVRHIGILPTAVAVGNRLTRAAAAVVAPVQPPAIEQTPKLGFALAPCEMNGMLLVALGVMPPSTLPLMNTGIWNWAFSPLPTTDVPGLMI